MEWNVQIDCSVASLQPPWAEYRAAHADWLARFPRDEPVYALPDAAIQSLASRIDKVPPALDARDVPRESAFTALCQGLRLVGVDGDRGVRDFWFDDVATRPDETTPRNLGWAPSLLSELAWGPGQVLAAMGGVCHTNRARGRLNGVAGWLMTEPDFLRDVRTLRQQWSELDRGERPPLPLDRPVPRPPDQGGLGIATPALTRWVQAGKEFLDHWGLVRLESWDLPVAQGPLFPDDLPAEAPARPRHGIHLYLPLHYALQGNDDLARQILNLQRQKAEALGVHRSLAGLAHHEAYAQIFRAIYLERAIRSRFAGGQPKGFVKHLVFAMAAEMGVGDDRVKQIRTAVKKCLAGRRDQVPWLE
jgi:hypothetical protein